MLNSSKNAESELEKAQKRLIQEVQDGLKHGFFEYSITCEIVKDRKRRVNIKAGKSHQFIIPEEDLPK